SRAGSTLPSSHPKNGRFSAIFRGFWIKPADHNPYVGSDRVARFVKAGLRTAVLLGILAIALVPVAAAQSVSTCAVTQCQSVPQDQPKNVGQAHPVPQPPAAAKAADPSLLDRIGGFLGDVGGAVSASAGATKAA